LPVDPGGTIVNRSHYTNRFGILSTMVALLIAACQPLDGGPEVGAISPTKGDQIRELEPLLKRPSHPLAGKSDLAGAQSVDLRSGFHSVVMVEKHPDGSHSAICTDSLERATEFLASPARKPVEYQ
jgi:hypothetical protein